MPSTYTLADIKKLAKRRTPAALTRLRQIAEEQTERRDQIVRRDMALRYARVSHGEERKAFAFDAAHAVHRLNCLPTGTRAMRRAAERAVRKADSVQVRRARDTIGK